MGKIHRWFALSLLLGVFGTALAGVEDDVRAADDKRHAGLAANDMEAWTAVMSDEVIYIHSSGVMDAGKEQLTAPFRKGEIKIKSFDREVIGVRKIDDDVFQVIGSGTPTVIRDGKETTFNLIYTSTWAKVGESWKMVHWQATRLPGK